MTHVEALKTSRHQQLVPDEKFDRHMERARLRDIDNRKAIFSHQTENGEQSREERRTIKSSTY